MSIVSRFGAFICLNNSFSACDVNNYPLFMLWHYSYIMRLNVCWHVCVMPLVNSLTVYDMLYGYLSLPTISCLFPLEFRRKFTAKARNARDTHHHTARVCYLWWNLTLGTIRHIDKNTWAMRRAVPRSKQNEKRTYFIWNSSTLPPIFPLSIFHTHTRTHTHVWLLLLHSIHMGKIFRGYVKHNINEL